MDESWKGTRRILSQPISNKLSSHPSNYYTSCNENRGLEVPSKDIRNLISEEEFEMRNQKFSYKNYMSAPDEVRESHQRHKNSINKENFGISDDLHWVLEDYKGNSEFDNQNSSASIQSNKIDRGKELLTITVEIGNGQKEKIIIFENDDPQKISEEFCLRHEISEDLQEIFINQINENINQVKEEIAQEEANLQFADKSDLILNEINNYNQNYTQKQNEREGINLIDSLGEINNSTKLTPYNNYLNYSQTITGTWSHHT